MNLIKSFIFSAISLVVISASAQEVKTYNAVRTDKALEMKYAVELASNDGKCWPYSRIKAGVMMNQIKPSILGIIACGCTEKQAETTLHLLVVENVIVESGKEWKLK